MTQTTLVLNAGSSSVKFAVAHGRKIFVRGLIDHFGSAANVTLTSGHHRSHRTAAIRGPRAAFVTISGMIKHLNIVPTVVVHRIVHGGQKYSQPTKLTASVLRDLHWLIDLAPLHQPVNLLGVEFAKRTWPKATVWGVFDTAIYRVLPTKVKTYALPTTITRRLHIEKYGFHGLAHAWAFRQAAKQLNLPRHKFSVVTVNLGSGASITLWQRGQPIDTTMGFTPLEGLIMSTRSGDIDPAIPLYIQERLGWSAGRVKKLLEQHAGLLGLTGLHDMRDILGAAGHPVAGWPRRQWTSATRVKARQALDMFIYHTRRALAGYLGLLPVQAIVFTGPIGANQTIQKLILHDLPAAHHVKHLTVVSDEEQAIVEAVHA